MSSLPRFLFCGSLYKKNIGITLYHRISFLLQLHKNNSRKCSINEFAVETCNCSGSSSNNFVTLGSDTTQKRIRHILLALRRRIYCLTAIFFWPSLSYPFPLLYPDSDLKCHSVRLLQSQKGSGTPTNSMSNRHKAEDDDNGGASSIAIHPRLLVAYLPTTNSKSYRL